MNLTPLSQLRRAAKARPTLQALAKRLGCSHVTLSKFETGQTALSPKLLAAYAKAIAVPVERVRDAFSIVQAAFFNGRAAEANRQLEERLGVKMLPRKRATAGE